MNHLEIMAQDGAFANDNVYANVAALATGFINYEDYCSHVIMTRQTNDWY